MLTSVPRLADYTMTAVNSLKRYKLVLLPLTKHWERPFICSGTVDRIISADYRGQLYSLLKIVFHVCPLVALIFNRNGNIQPFCPHDLKETQGPPFLPLTCFLSLFIQNPKHCIYVLFQLKDVSRNTSGLFHWLL